MNKRFDFKDLMTFGLFILPLLTFVSDSVLKHRKTTPTLTEYQGGFF